jgi:polyisoprenoid-binding protein YceI
MLNTRRSRLGLAGAAVIVLVVVGVGGWWFFIRDDAPPKADIGDVDETLEETSGQADAGSEELEGAWSVDTTVGSFEDFSGTFAGYRIQEELATIGGNTAVGRTPDVSGSIAIAGDQVTEATFDVDMTTLESDDGRRDNQLRQRGLETDRFPMASFTLTEPIELPEDATSGDTLTVEATGQLDLHGVPQTVTAQLEAKLADGAIAIVAEAPVVLADYGIEPPTGLSVLSVADEGLIEFQVFLRHEAT